MELEFQEDINKIEDCPLGNENKDKILYRWVSNPLTIEDFIPHSIQKSRLKKKCIAWGLSTFDSVAALNEKLENLTPVMKEKFPQIAKANITEETGIKYKSTQTNGHYTYFPKKGVDLLTIFKPVDNE